MQLMSKIFPILLCASALSLHAATFDLNVVNQANSGIDDPWITFVQSLDTTDTYGTNGITTTALNGPALSAQATISGSSTALVNGVAYQLSTITSNISIDADWAGNIFFSNGALALGASGQSASILDQPFSQPILYPTNPNGAVTADTLRYNYIELGGGSSTVIAPDITYINFFSVPLQMTRLSDGATRGAPSSQTALDNLRSTLTSLSGSSTTVVVNDANGVARIVSPDNGATAQGAYP